MTENNNLVKSLNCTEKQEVLSKKFYNIENEKIIDYFTEDEYESYINFGICLCSLTVKILTKISNYRDSEIFKKRMGIIDCEINTNEFIAKEYNITKEEVKQLIDDICIKLKKYKDEYIVILNKIPNNKILNYLIVGVLNVYGLSFLELIFKIVDNRLSKLIINKIRTYTHPKINRKYQNKQQLEQSIYNLIQFSSHKKENCLSDFYSLTRQRDIFEKNNIGKVKIKSIGVTLEYESLLEKKLLIMFGKFSFVSKMKTQSLYIKYYENGKKKKYYPDVQILTKNGELVIIEIKPYFNMMDSKVIQKYLELHKYCKKYGYGYLIMDDECNTYETLKQIYVSKEIQNMFINIIKQKKEINYKDIINFKKNTGIRTKEIVKIVIDNYGILECNVKPFSIKYIGDN